MIRSNADVARNPNPLPNLDDPNPKPNPNPNPLPNLDDPTGCYLPGTDEKCELPTRDIGLPMRDSVTDAR